MSDMPLFNGGAIHAHHEPHVTPCVPLHVTPKFTQSQQGANTTKRDSARAGPFKVMGILLLLVAPASG